jgi:hypothetical protein
MNGWDEARETERCETCKFFEPGNGKANNGRCHRHAPPTYNFLRYYELELLREIAWDVRVIADIAPPDKDNADLNTEATEAISISAWPEVEPNEWCGEWMERK